jgi:hypothetical protein
MATFHCAGISTEAANVHLAARIFADLAAKQRYGEDGMATYIAETNESGVFRVFVGVYERHGRTVGETIFLTLTAEPI